MLVAQSAGRRVCGANQGSLLDGIFAEPWAPLHHPRVETILLSCNSLSMRAPAL